MARHAALGHVRWACFAWNNSFDLCYRLLYSVAAMPADLIDRLNTYRLEHKLSQVQLAERLDVAFQTVNRWLNRRVKPSQIQEYQIRKLVRLSNSKSRRSAKASP